MATIAPSHRSPAGYTRVAITLHWVIAAMVAGNLAGGILADNVDRATAGAILSVHKPLGITVLALSLVRLGWRLAHGFPRFPESTPAWDAVLSRATHVAFYRLMIAVPLAGWMTVSAGPRPLEWFGLFPIPKLPVGEATADAAHGAHVRLAWLMLALIVIHVVGALKHHWVDRDDVLARMLPVVRR
jgi:cytochrome b561